MYNWITLLSHTAWLSYQSGVTHTRAQSFLWPWPLGYCRVSALTHTPCEGHPQGWGQGQGLLTDLCPFLTSQCLRWSRLGPVTATASVPSARRSARRSPVLEPRHQGPRRPLQVDAALPLSQSPAVLLPPPPASFRTTAETLGILESHKLGTLGHLRAIRLP